LERMRKGAAVAYLLLLSQHVAEGNEKPKSWEPLSEQKLEPECSRIRSMGANNEIVIF
jgi:hypothetical protein